LVISLSGAKALVTGGSRGIGSATALKLADAGADVCITYLNSARNARELAEEVTRRGRRAVVVKADLSEPEDVEELCRIVATEFGRLDVLVSNAAGGGFRGLLDTTAGQFDYAMRVNVQSLMLLARFAAPLLEKTAFRRAKLVTMSSMGAIRAIPMYGLIGAAKGAVESMTRHLALELAPRKTNVNCVRAGLVDTGALSQLPKKEAVLAERRKRALTGNIDLTPEDVAGAVVFLSSPLADQIQGQILVIDGGTSLHP
jgi:enoyl-[acyl-carrier protein] reductase III